MHTGMGTFSVTSFSSVVLKQATILILNDMQVPSMLVMVLGCVCVASRAREGRLSYPPMRYNDGLMSFPRLSSSL